MAGRNKPALEAGRNASYWPVHDKSANDPKRSFAPIAIRVFYGRNTRLRQRQRRSAREDRREGCRDSPLFSRERSFATFWRSPAPSGCWAFFWSAELGPENCSRRAVSRGASYGPSDLLDSAGPDFDPARLSVLSFGNAQGQHAVLQVGTDFFRI